MVNAQKEQFIIFIIYKCKGRMNHQREREKLEKDSSYRIQICKYYGEDWF